MGYRILALALLCVTPLQALAAYALKTEIETKEGEEESETLVLESGKAGSVTAGNLTLKVTPVRVDDSTVRIKAEVTRAVGGAKPELMSTPSVVVRIGEPATFSEMSKDGVEEYKIRVVAKEK